MVRADEFVSSACFCDSYQRECVREREKRVGDFGYRISTLFLDEWPFDMQ